MKRVILLLLCFIVACKKDNDTNICDSQAILDNMPIYNPGTMEHGALTACRNGKNWEGGGQAGIYAERDSMFAVGGNTYTYDGIWREVLGISEVPLQLGKYTVFKHPLGVGGFIGKTTASFTTIVSDGDLIGDVYDLDESQNNYVEITALDTIANKVAGYFELHFVVQQPKIFDTNNNNLYFKNGTFEVDIME